MSADILGKQAYQKIMLNEYKEAVNILNKAIAKHPKDAKLYVNRCYSYIQMQDFQNALDDAFYLTENFPENPRGYFLTGEIYLMLREFEGAECQFSETLKIVKKSIEVEEKLFESQIEQILAKGYEIDVARKALRIAHTVKEAIRSLDSGLIKNGDDNQRDIRFQLTTDEDIFFGKEFEKLEGGSTSSSGKAKQIIKKPVKLKTLDPVMDPTNPLKCCSIWVGNVSEETQENSFKHLFAQIGGLKSVNLLADKKIAFVNYTTPEAAGNAMKEFQDYPYKGARLVLKYQSATFKKN